MDPLTEIFSSLRTYQATYTRLEATAPWGVRSHGGEQTRVSFIFLIRGGGLLQLKNGNQPVALAAGDIFMLFEDEPYTLVDQPSSVLLDCAEVEKMRIGSVIAIGGGGAPTTFMSGSFAIDPLDVKPLLAVLPRFLLIRLEQHRSHALQSVLELLAMETAAPGMATEALIHRLYEILFVHAIRAYTSSHPALPAGWLAAIVDKNLGPVIGDMHRDLGRDWTVRIAGRKGRHVAFFVRREVQVDRRAVAHGVSDSLADAPGEYPHPQRSEVAAGNRRAGRLRIGERVSIASSSARSALLPAHFAALTASSRTRPSYTTCPVRTRGS